MEYLPLAVDTKLDTATPIRQANQDQQNNSINHERILQEHYQSMDAREKSRLSSVIAGAVQLKPFLDNNDIEGARNFLMRRKQMLHSRMGGGENIDTEDTDAALQMLNSGDIQGLQQGVAGLMAAGQVYGILDYNNTAGGDTGILADRLVKEGSAKNVKEALELIKGGAGQAGKNAADISTGYEANYQTQQGKNVSDVQNAGAKGYNYAAGSAAGAAVVKNDTTLNSLNDLEYSISQAEQLLPKVSATGPILGRVGDAAEDPDYKNLQGAINSITLQAKDLYNLGSGAGFTDADRDFLRDVIAGKYARAETIQMGLQRFRQALENRRRNLQNQNQNYQTQYGGGQSQPQQQPQGSGQRVRIRDPKTGRTGTVDAADAQAAQSQGYEIIQ